VSGVRWSWPDATVTRVIDGDTLVARVTRDIGFHGSLTFDVRIRLNRINAAPANTPDGDTTTAVLTGLVVGYPVLVETVKPYKYGDEWMAEITLPDGRNISDLLVNEGLALYWDGHGPRPGG
jgi:endonuclease YncB( thermonuclease family)